MNDPPLCCVVVWLCFPVTLGNDSPISFSISGGFDATRYFMFQFRVQKLKCSECCWSMIMGAGRRSDGHSQNQYKLIKRLGWWFQHCLPCIAIWCALPSQPLDQSGANCEHNPFSLGVPLVNSRSLVQSTYVNSFYIQGSIAIFMHPPPTDMPLKQDKYF